MSYDDRSQTAGTHAIVCDVPGCHAELLAPTMEDAFSDANLAGWIARDNNGTEEHACLSCHSGGAIKRAMASGDIRTEAPGPVRAGDPVIDEDGKQIGEYMQDAAIGDEVPVKLDIPDDPVGPRASDYDAMLEGTGDDAERMYRSAVAADEPAPAPTASAPPVGAPAFRIEQLAEDDPFEGIAWDPTDE